MRLKNPKLTALLVEFSLFSVIGVVATIVHYSILVALVERAHLPVVLSTSIGFIFGAIVSYGLNRRITFTHQPEFGRGLLKFVSVGMVGLGINALIVAGLSHAGLPYMLAQVAATGVVLVWNFGVARLIIFRPQPTIS